MVEIEYLKTESGYDNCFSFLYREKEYIPEEFFDESETGVEHKFLLFLLKKHKILDNDAKGDMVLWDISYQCNYRGIPFTMVYDTDWDMVSFSVDPKNIEHKTMIAEKIKKMIETEKSLKK